jgi:hypothetical protein
MLTSNQIDYSFDYFKTNNVEESTKENKKEQYNPYVNNSGTVMGN